MAEKKRKRFGDRKEGRRLRSLDAYYGFAPYIMRTRNDANNSFSDSFDITELDGYLRKKRAGGMPGLGILHFYVAAFVRLISQKPALNRFISGQRIYARDGIEFIMSIKKEMSVDGGETSIKVKLSPGDTIDDVYRKINAEVKNVREDSADTSTDNVAGALMKIPRLFLKFAVFIITVLDYFDLLPRVLLDASPFHGSFIVTDLGSVGLPPVAHHLYNIGNLPVFIAFGAKRKAYEPAPDGSVAARKYLDTNIVVDERICDGFYFAQCYKLLKDIFKNPGQLDTPPETIVADVP